LTPRGSACFLRTDLRVGKEKGDGRDHGEGQRMKKSVALVLTLCVMVSVIVLAAAPAGAAPVGARSAQLGGTCVDNYEWNHYRVGVRKNYVEYVFGTRGWRLSSSS
jgi:hypothetical protein